MRRSLQLCPLGYPSDVLLSRWVDELHPGRRQILSSIKNLDAPFDAEVKRQAVSDLCTRPAFAREIAQKVGVSRQQLYKWKDELIGNEDYLAMRKRKGLSTEKDRDSLLDELTRLKQQILRQQMELDILNKAEELIKKDRGISAQSLTNREKTLVVDALRHAHPTARLLGALQLARSSYFYHRAALCQGGKYAAIRTTLAEIFNGNYRCYGYRRLHAMLRHEGLLLSEKVVRRLMAEEQLVVSRPRRRRYSSYCGEIGSAPDNLIARDFKAALPNQKWLTDITEFQLSAGKEWLSPVLDCFDGKVVSWSLSTHPNAELANTMLEDAIDTLKTSDRPIIHSDRGGHYRWPGWLARVNAAGLIR